MAGMQREQGSTYGWDACAPRVSAWGFCDWVKPGLGLKVTDWSSSLKCHRAQRLHSVLIPPPCPSCGREARTPTPTVNPVVWGMGTSVGCCCQKQPAWRSGFARNKFFIYIYVLLHKKEKSMLLKLSASCALLRIKGWWAVCLRRLWQTLKLWEYLNTAVETEFGRLRSGGLSSLSWVWCSEWSSLPERIRNTF